MRRTTTTTASRDSRRVRLRPSRMMPRLAGSEAPAEAPVASRPQDRQIFPVRIGAALGILQDLDFGGRAAQRRRELATIDGIMDGQYLNGLGKAPGCVDGLRATRRERDIASTDYRRVRDVRQE
jgi:hypothetical protein